jgi:sigma-B regulation protein RsbU (phosphoserine phosphatase)
VALLGCWFHVLSACMHGSDLQLSANQVLAIFNRDALYLLFGAVFMTFGLIAGIFAFWGRKFDAMLMWLALFAILYGLRLWLQLGFVGLLLPHTVFVERLRTAINYLVPIPAFFYLASAGFIGRQGRRVSVLLSIVFGGLFVGCMAIGFRNAFDLINNVVVIGSLIVLVIQSVRMKSTKDFVIVRAGLFVFVAFALFDNIRGALRHYSHKEPWGFAVFLGVLGYVAAKRKVQRDQEFNQIQQELEIARRIQLDILPSDFPHSSHFDVAARYVPMTSVAGDFYDFLVVDEGQAGLLIADVAGHGVPAALIASMVKMAATSQRGNLADPGAFLAGMNAVLCGNTQQQFVTAAFVHLDAESASLRYSAAGHPPMLLLRGNEVLEVEENGLMLAAFSFSTYTTVVHSLEPGDRLLLYTDGIVEAANAEEDEFGRDRLSLLLRETAKLSPRQAVDHIVDVVQRWAKAQGDDLTLLLCDYGGQRVRTKIPEMAG